MPQKPANLNHRWMFASLMLVLLALSACGLLSGGADSGCDPDILNAIRIAPPASVGDLTESCVNGFAPGNAQYRATFKLAPADLSEFQASTRITTLQTTAPDSAIYKDEAAKLSALQYGSFGDGAIMEEILVDTSNPQEYTVYFYRAFVD